MNTCVALYQTVRLRPSPGSPHRANPPDTGALSPQYCFGMYPAARSTAATEPEQS
jgi:hypothetical protein